MIRKLAASECKAQVTLIRELRVSDRKGETMTTTHNQSSTLFNDLAALLTGQLFLPEDAAYEQVRQLWNGKVKTRPAAIARCLTVEDVIQSVRWTRSQGLPLSVRGAGHEIFGRSLRENGVAIDLSQMRAHSPSSRWNNSRRPD